MYMKGMFMLFFSLGLGYLLCVVAKKQEKLLKTVGYTLGISILVLSLLFGLAMSCPKLSSICGPGSPLSKICPAGAMKCPFMK